MAGKIMIYISDDVPSKPLLDVSRDYLLKLICVQKMAYFCFIKPSCESN